MRIFRIVLFVSFLIVVLVSAANAVDSCPSLSHGEVKRQMTSISDDIRFHDRLYYQQAKPIVSDSEYDLLHVRLRKLESCFPALAAVDSPTRSVGGAAAQHLTVAHSQPMLSLDSSSDDSAVVALFERIEQLNPGERLRFLAQPKVDGLPVELTYVQGKLVSAATRGDGLLGEDVLARVGEIEGVPVMLRAQFPPRVVVRGEVYAVLPEFIAGNNAQQNEDDRYASPRHLAVATLRAKHPRGWALKTLRFFPFELVNAEVLDVDSALRGLERLARWGLPVLLEQTEVVEDVDQVRSLYREYLAHRADLPFAADGIVIKVDRLDLQRRLGLGERFPFWAAAWKFPPATAVTRVTDLEWRIGRTGKRTPIALLDPVKIGRIQVSRASLHHIDTLRSLGVTAGCRVVVALKGDTVPQIVDVVDRPEGDAGVIIPPEYLLPPEVGACFSDSDGCHQQFVARAVYFAQQLGLSGLGEGRVSQLVEAGLIGDLPSFFELQVPRMMALPGFGTVRAERIGAVLRANNRPDLAQLLSAIGVAGVGPKTCQKLAREFETLDELRLAGPARLAAIDGVSARSAENLQTFFASDSGVQLVTRLRRLGILDVD